MRKSKKLHPILILLLMLLPIIAFFFLFDNIISLFFPNNDNLTDSGMKTSDIVIDIQETEPVFEVIATGLEVPWGIEFLPGGDLLVTERPGRIVRIGTETKKVHTLTGLYTKGEAGLMGIALHPNFSTNHYIYIMATYANGGEITNQVERYTLAGDNLTERKVILFGIKGAANHDGGRIKFGPDGFLYITTGDAQSEKTAQDKTSLNGKILRITDDGEPAPGNPFGNEIYSYGHRNPQGLAWDDDSNLWETEHGPSGTATGNDEINFITPGENYGWSNFVGQESGTGITTPVLESGKGNTWAPASLAFCNGSLFFGGLRGEALYEAKINSLTNLSLKAHFKGEYGRIRDVMLGPDGYLYFSTSNRDGRGNPNEGDDKIIRVNPEIF